jgi:protein TonB
MRSGRRNTFYLDPGRIVVLPDFNKDDDVIPPPPPPPAPPDNIDKISYQPPVIVEEPADGGNEFGTNMDMLNEVENLPVPADLVNVVPPPEEIDEPDPPAELFPEEQASFNNGDLNEFRNWVQANVIYPQAAVELGIFGKVIIEFCVNARGEVVDIKLLRGIDLLVDNAAIKTITASPLWKPARQGGRPVKQRFTMPVVFKMLN